MRISIISLLILTTSLPSICQDGYYVDALRYASTQFGGTARTMGIGGAGTSIGADLGAVYFNPAGLGFYRKSDISITPSVGGNSSKSNFMGHNTSDNKLYFAVNNVGIAICFAKDNNTVSDWRGGTLSFSQNRIANFNSTFSFDGNNANSSMADAFVQQSTGIRYNQFSDKTGSNYNSLLGLAYRTYITNDFNFLTGIDADAYKYYNLLPAGAVMRQKGTINTSGSMSQWDLSYGNNYKDLVYIGGSVGILGMVYNQNRTYSEYLNNASTYSNVMTDFTLTDQLKANGTGVNANLGVIVRPVDFIRIGLAFRTPSLMWVTETSSMSLSAHYAFNSNSQNAPPSSVSNSGNGQSFSYALSLPYHANGGVSIFFKKYGFISFDAEYVDYSSTILLKNDNSSTDFSGANTNIQNYSNTSALNLRGGAEARLDIFRIRGGFAYYAQPYQNGIDNVDRNTKIITLGFGIKQPNFYIDFAYMRPMFNSGYQLYSLNNSSSNPFVTTSNVGGSGSITFGFNF